MLHKLLIAATALALAAMIGTASAATHEVKVNPPICETTIVAKVYPADKECSKDHCSSASGSGVSYVTGENQVARMHLSP